MTDTPNVGAPQWAASQGSPWLTMNRALRVFDALAVAVIIDEMDRTAPPATCNDGARYLVQSPATGLWSGHEGELAVAWGANAVNGWEYVTVATEGMLLFNREDSKKYRYLSGVWEEFADAAARISDLLDVDLAGLADGHILRWDASNGFWYASEDTVSFREIPVFNFTSDGEARFYADEAMTVDQQATSGTGSVAYEKSTAGAPSTFNSTSSPISLEAGAWLKVTASSVTDLFAVALKRTA